MFLLQSLPPSPTAVKTRDFQSCPGLFVPLWSRIVHAAFCIMVTLLKAFVLLSLVKWTILEENRKGLKY